jgi:hypothetical protein
MFHRFCSLVRAFARAARIVHPMPRRSRPSLEPLEERTVPTVAVAIGAPPTLTAGGSLVYVVTVSNSGPS